MFEQVRNLITLLLLFLAACNTTNWNQRIGIYSYNDALREHGPPNQSERMNNGSTVHSWELARGAAWVDKLILVFDSNGRLVSGEEKRY